MAMFLLAIFTWPVPPNGSMDPWCTPNAPNDGFDASLDFPGQLGSDPFGQFVDKCIIQPCIQQWVDMPAHKMVSWNHPNMIMQSSGNNELFSGVHHLWMYHDVPK